MTGRFDFDSQVGDCMRRIGLLLALVLLGGALLVPGIALARVSEYQVQFTPRGASGVGQLIVNVVLSPETELPATVQVPLPAGATVVWSGEIVGADPTADPFREAVVTPAGGGQIATFTLEKVRVAQVEADLAPPTVSGTDISSVLSWVNTTEEGPYSFSIVLEAGAGDVRISPAPVGEPARNEAGETLYRLTPVRLAEGRQFAVDVRYSLGGSSGTGGGMTLAITIAVVLLVAALIALIVVVRIQRSTPRPQMAGNQPAPSRQSRADAREARATAAGEERTVPADETAPDEDGGDFFTFD
jgi:hypothetical protein